MPLPVCFFSDLEMKHAEQKIISHLTTPLGQVFMDSAKIQEHIVSIYTELVVAEPEAIQHLHEGLPNLSMVEADKCEQELSLGELIIAIAALL